MKSKDEIVTQIVILSQHKVRERKLATDALCFKIRDWHLRMHIWKFTQKKTTFGLNYDDDKNKIILNVWENDL